MSKRNKSFTLGILSISICFISFILLLLTYLNFPFWRNFFSDIKEIGMIVLVILPLISITFGIIGLKIPKSETIYKKAKVINIISIVVSIILLILVAPVLLSVSGTPCCQPSCSESGGICRERVSEDYPCRSGEALHSVAECHKDYHVCCMPLN